MAITSELLGKLGGADVEVIPVEGSTSGGSGTEVIMHTVEVPKGESWLIMVMGEMDAGYTTSSGSPSLMLGTIKTNRYGTQSYMTVAGVHAEPVDVKLRRGTSLGSDSFTGHVYIVKM